MKILDLKLTYRCNNNCHYCCQDRKLRTMSTDFTTEQVEKIILREKQLGNIFDKVVLTGGEVTLNRDLFKIIDILTDNKISNIQLQTNAKKLEDMNYCKLLVNAGIRNFGISLHGATREIHESFTNTNSSYDMVIRALDNLKEIGKCNIAINCVITKSNINRLIDLVEFADKNQYATSLQFAFMHLTGAAVDINEELIHISEAACSVRNAMQYAKNKMIRVQSEAIPFCLMRNHEKSVAEIYSASEIITYDYSARREFTKLQKDLLKKKGPLCKECLFYNMCDGTWREYPDKLGFDEFKPVKEFDFKCE